MSLACKISSLIIEDQARCSRLLKKILGREVILHCASPNEDALRLLDKDPVDIVLVHLDPLASELFELIRRIRTHYFYLPIFILASRYTKRLLVDLINIGIDRCYTLSSLSKDLLPEIQRFATRYHLLKTQMTLLERDYIGIVTDMPHAVLKARRFILMNFYKPITTRDVANFACLEESYFCRLFKKHMALTPLQFINLLRLELAKSLLRHSNLSVCEISEASGFGLVDYFIKLFKRAEKMTPVRYRKLYRTERQIHSIKSQKALLKKVYP